VSEIVKRLPWSTDVRDADYPPSDWLYVRDGRNVGMLTEADTIRLLSEKYGWSKAHIARTFKRAREIKCGGVNYLYRTAERVIHMEYIL